LIIVEGERKVDAARRLFPGYVAVSPMNGAKSPHKSDWRPLAGRNVTIWPDHDKPGLEFANDVAKLNAAAASIAVVTIPNEWPKGWDLADVPPDGVGSDTLLEILTSAEARVLAKPAHRSKPAKGPAPEQEITTEVCRLVTLSRIRYEIERVDVAAKLGIRVPVLDRLVKIERGDVDVAHGADKAVGGSGRPLEFPEIDLWPEPVDGAGLLADLSKASRDYVIMTQAQGDAVALWVMQTHLFAITEVAPKLLIKSVEKRSGKTRLVVDVLRRLVPRPQTAANVTAATLFRVIDQYCPTLLLDEVDTYLKDDPELHGIINSGFNKEGAKVLRAVPAGDGWEVREFSTWCPQAIAGIGHMPETITDRSFLIHLRRKLPTETVKRLGRHHGGPLVELARKVARWAADHQRELEEAIPEMPNGLNDRAADAWEFCIAIADLAGGEWPQRARAAALEVSGDGTAENETTRIKLLSDIRDIFDDMREETLFSWEIVKKLVELNNRPWAEWGKDRKQISATAMSRLLSDLLPPGVKPGSVWKAGKSGKGYHRKDLEDSFARYLSPKTPSKTAERQDPRNSLGFSNSQSVKPDADLTLPKSLKAAEAATPDVVTFSDLLSEKKRANEADFDDPDRALHDAQRSDGNMELPVPEYPEASVSPESPKRRRVTL